MRTRDDQAWDADLVEHGRHLPASNPHLDALRVPRLRRGGRGAKAETRRREPGSVVADASTGVRMCKDTNRPLSRWAEERRRSIVECVYAVAATGVAGWATGIGWGGGAGRTWRRRMGTRPRPAHSAGPPPEQQAMRRPRGRGG